MIDLTRLCYLLRVRSRTLSTVLLLQLQEIDRGLASTVRCGRWSSCRKIEVRNSLFSVECRPNSPITIESCSGSLNLTTAICSTISIIFAFVVGQDFH